MSINRDIEDLLEISQELKKETRLRILRNILKILLIGFLIGRDIDRKISETRSRIDLVVKRIQEYFDEVERLLKQLEEMRKVDAFTARVSEKEFLARLLSLGQDLKFLVTRKAKKGLALVGKGDIGEYNKIVLNCTGEYLEQRKNTVRNQVDEIRNSGTYLIYIEKECVNETIRLLKGDLECFKSNGVLLESYLRTRLN